MNQFDPKNFKLEWYELLLIIVGPAANIPIIGTGYFLGESYGFSNALSLILFGNLALAVLGLIFASIGYQHKAPTSLAAIYYLGKMGAWLLTLVLSVAILFWFAISLHSFYNHMTLIFPQIEGITFNTTLNFILGIIFALTCSLFTWKSLFIGSAINLLALFSLLSIVFIKGFSFNPYAPEIELGENGYAGISLVIANGIVHVLVLPTYTQYAKSEKSYLINTIIPICIFLSFFQFLGVFLSSIYSLTNHENSFSQLLVALPLSTQIVLFFFLLSATYATALINVFPISINLSAMTGISFKKIALFSGILGSLVAMWPLLNQLEDIVIQLAIIIASLEGVFLAAYFVQMWLPNVFTTQNFFIQVITLIFGVLIGNKKTLISIDLTNNAILDAFLAGIFGYLVLSLFKSSLFLKPNRQINEK